uniref:Uncharacterized protein n=1 Tax=Virgibacillus oceani TaxID=1479511 RepID=A0A917HJ36_9BACI|nr:hypothetical protein GCM10011398_27750 [Virgibacillus oceani]
MLDSIYDLFHKRVFKSNFSIIPRKKARSRKKVKTKYKNLIQCRVKKGKACEWANTYWRVAKNSILQKAPDDQYWSKQGLKVYFIDIKLYVELR